MGAPHLGPAAGPVIEFQKAKYRFADPVDALAGIDMNPSGSRRLHTSWIIGRWGSDVDFAVDNEWPHLGRGP